MCQLFCYSIKLVIGVTLLQYQIINADEYIVSGNSVECGCGTKRGMQIRGQSRKEHNELYKEAMAWTSSREKDEKVELGPKIEARKLQK